MITATVDVATPDGICDAYTAYPSAEPGRHPAVLMLPNALGPRPVLFDMARRLAAEGYFVVVPNMSYRERRAPLLELPAMLEPGRSSELSAVLTELVEAVTPENTVVDVEALVAYLATREEVRPGPVGITGYCLGGVIALRAAARLPEKIAAAASFHGGFAAAAAADAPDTLAGNIEAELYFAHASDDQSMPPERVAELEERLTAAGVRYRSEVYPGTRHGFTMADMPSVYSAEAAERGWREMVGLFGRVLKG